MTKQEMFDKAYRGLASQGWTQAIEDGICRYRLEVDGKVRRCAWGWVDPEGSAPGDTGVGRMGTVSELMYYEDGIARTLDDDGHMFALTLQQTHDNRGNELTPDELKAAFDALAERTGLTIPQL